MGSSNYRFGDFRVNPASRELWRGDRLVALPPHVFDCVAYLIERHDRAVGRDELVAAVWGKTEINDTLLGQTIMRIRRELGDDAKGQRVLRTIPRFGYRWVAPLSAEDAVEAQSSAVGAAVAESRGTDATQRAARTGRHLRPRNLITVFRVAALVIALLAIAFVRYTRNPPSAPSASVPVSAVMPAAVEPGAEWSWMRFGVMDVVATQLRSSGLASVPTENVVALISAPAANGASSVRDATSANLVVTPRVHHVDGDWQVDLEAENSAGQRFTADARGHDVTKAARDATDKLLVALGRRPPQQPESAPSSALVERIDAAILADDPDSARTLINDASVEEQRSAEIRLLLAKIDFRAGRIDVARERLTTLLDEAPAQTAPVLRASILNGLGAAAIRSDAPEQAEHFFGDAIALLVPPHSDSAQLGQAYLGRAAAAADQRHFEVATADYSRARVTLREANDNLALIRVAANEGFMDFDQDRPAAALPQFQTASDGFKKWGALNEAIFTYIGQINCYLALLDGRAAMQAADAASTLAQRIDNPSTLASLAIARARALAAVGRLREARGALDHLRESSDDATTLAASGAVLARLEMDDNNAGAAEDLAERAVQTMTAPSYAATRAEAWLTQVRAQLRSADAAKAGASAAAFETWAARNDYGRARVFAKLARAEFSLHFDAAKTWRADFDAARRLAETNGVPFEIAAVARSYALALLADGDMDAAQIEVGRVSRWAEQDFGCAVLEARLFAALGHDEARQTAVARARSLAGERKFPVEALATPISTRTSAVE